MKLAIYILITMMQPVVGQDYTDGYETMANPSICLSSNGKGLPYVGGAVGSEEECFELCSSNAWCLGISRRERNGGIWCELDTSAEIACMAPPIDIVGFTPGCSDTSCLTQSGCSITGSSDRSNGQPGWECWKKSYVATEFTRSLALSMATSSTPTLAPSTTAAEESEFYINNTGIPTANIISSDEIKIFLPFNTSNRHYGADVFLKDCLTSFDSASYFLVGVTDLTSNAPDGFIQFNTTLTVNITALNGTSHWNTFTDGTRGGWAEACVETYLEVEDTHASVLVNDDSYLKTNFKNHVLNISVSLTSDFDFTPDNSHIKIEEIPRRYMITDDSEFITAYVCEADTPYVENVERTYNQGEEITICVSDNDSGIVQVENFVDLKVSQDGGNSNYNYIKDSLWNRDITTPRACIDGTTKARRVCYAKIRALPHFFENEDPADLIISGSVLVVRDGREVRRNLHIALPTPEENKTLAVSSRRVQAEGEKGIGHFEVKVSLRRAAGSAVPGFTAEVVAVFVYMAVGAALMA